MESRGDGGMEEKGEGGRERERERRAKYKKKITDVYQENAVSMCYWLEQQPLFCVLRKDQGGGSEEEIRAFFVGGGGSKRPLPRVLAAGDRAPSLYLAVVCKYLLLLRYCCSRPT